MLRFVVGRIWQSLVVLFVMSLLVFVGVYAIGNPVDIFISPETTQADRAAAIAALGLDQPLWTQYIRFLGQALSGDLGRSFAYATPAVTLILERLPATLELAISALVLSVTVGVPLGVWAALHRDRWIGKTIMGLSILGFSLPTFWVGLMLIMIFAVDLGWLPSTGRGETATWFGITSSVFTVDGLRHLAMPALNLALFKISLIIRLARAGMRENMLMDYVRFARAKGLPMRRVVMVHVFKNIMIPVVTVVGLELGSTIAFAVVTESIFAWPGMGKLIIDSIQRLDRPVIVAYLCIIVLMFVIINLVVDILYSVLDPRVRLSEARN